MLLVFRFNRKVCDSLELIRDDLIEYKYFFRSVFYKKIIIYA